MLSIPEWAPNAHPLFVHFPLALLFTAVLLDGLALVARPFVWLRFTAVTTYVIASVAAVVTYFTGKAAADAVTLPAAAQSVLTDHANLAEWTAWFFGIYAVVRLAVLWFDRKHERLALHLPLFLIALGGLYLPWQTGEHGSMMVYKYGVGVQAAVIENPVEHDHDHGDSADEHEADEHTAGGEQAAGEAGMQHAQTPSSTLEVSENGSWQWAPGEGAAQALAGSTFRWLAGSPETVRPVVVTLEAQGTVLALKAEDSLAFFVVDRPVSSLQADAVMNLQGFDGALMLVHHVRDAQNYDFMSIEGTTLRLGRVREGEPSVFDEGTFQGEPWLRLRVVGDEDHFRGYVNDELVLHGHGREAAAGAVGLRFSGQGTLLLDRLSVQTLR